MRLFCFLVGIFMFLGMNKLQGQSYVKGEIIVQLQDNFDIKTFEKESAASGLSLKMQNSLFPEKNIYLYSFDIQKYSHEKVLSQLKSIKSCLYAQNNHLLSNRTIPNDTYFDNQWQYINNGNNGGVVNADLDIELAWDISTGGVSALGDTIVVCVIDDGIDIDHEDLVDNLWHNRKEIPNNNIDDDGNGYIDDIHGWNMIQNNSNIAGGSHGTPVAAIIGGVGNNQKGISGVNWHIKLMIIKGGGNEAQAILAYRYPYIMRQKYNESAGLYGAFVVATNASWGVDNLQASAAPIWCNLYDELGSIGILNIASTSNSNVNVDIVGDMPTTCTSPYLLTVTNIRRDNIKEIGAAYGANSIDIGAYGSNVYTATNNNSYSTFGGTSAAAPHATGVAALLYAMPCLGLAYEAQIAPAATALQIKDMILQGGTANSSLQNITLTGNRLNAWGATQLAMAYNCNLPNCHTPFNIKTDLNIDNTLTLSWARAAYANDYTILFGLDNQNLQTYTTSDTFLVLTQLLPCENYIFQVAYTCSADNQNYSSNFFAIKTKNCCYAPTLLENIVVSDSSLSFEWNNSIEIENTSILYKNALDTIWQNSQTVTNHFTLSNLLPCTTYEIKLKSHCPTYNLENESIIFELSTSGCGICVDNPYCIGKAQSSNYEWISRIQINNFVHESGASIDGYSAEGLSLNAPIIDLRNPVSFDFTLQEHLSTANWSWWVWIDLNQDGIFDNNIELVYQSGTVSSTNINGLLNIPRLGILGNTRMRIAMRWGNIDLEACQIFSYGEVEDYCIIIDDNISTEEIQNTDTPVVVYPNPFEEKINILSKNTSSNGKIQLYLHDILGRAVYQGIIEAGENVHSIDTEKLAKGAYILSLEREYGIIFSQKLIK